MNTRITEDQWAVFERQGYLRLGSVMEPGELERLQARIDDIMLGRADIDYGRVMMQLDRDPERGGGRPGPQSRGHKGATLSYRKIQDLELDPAYLSFMQKPIFEEICERIYGPDTPVACFRAMFMNKPSGEGTPLVWHQDRWTDLDRDPLVTLWTALDPAVEANGCVKIIPGSHRRLINPSHGSGFLTEEQAEAAVAENEPVNMEVACGETVLMHNWMLHSSGTNSTDTARRAFSICFMDAATRSRAGHNFPVIFGEGALSPAL